MVSLVRKFNASSRGAVFFDTSMNMDDEEYLQPVLTSQEEDNFQKLDTVPIVSVPLLLGVCETNLNGCITFCHVDGARLKQCLICINIDSLMLQVALEIIGIVFVSLWPEEESKCNTYFIYLYLHCIYWLVVMVTDYVVKAKHHTLRIHGYLDFYQSTYQHIRTPLFITSLWNTCYLLLAVILHHMHNINYEQYCRASEWFTPINYILLLTTLELMVIIPVYVNYIKRVLRFNRLRPLPDVKREEWLSSFNQDSYASTSEIGHRHRGLNLEELLEKQADLIRYLHDHNVKLSHRMMMLASQRRAQGP